jgi:hypothetical protein
MQSIAFNKRDAFSGLGTVTIFIFVYFARILLVILLAIFISITLQKYLKNAKILNSFLNTFRKELSVSLSI